MHLPYHLIDVFTQTGFQGAQIAVFPHTADLSAELMQKLAAELTISETVFIMPATDGVSDFRIKIYTPTQELDFAGHPLLAVGYALRHVYAVTAATLRLQLNAEIISIAITLVDQFTKIQFSVSTVYRTDEYLPSTKELGEILHLDEKNIDQAELYPRLVSCRGDYLLVPVRSLQAFNAARFNVNKWTTSFVATLASRIGLVWKSSERDAASYRLRLLGKDIADASDPPVGSAAPAMAVYLFSELQAGEYHAMIQRGGDGKRKSLIEINLIKTATSVSAINVGGYAVQIGSGSITLD